MPRPPTRWLSRFAEGRGVPADLEEAARWYERAANKGLAPAQFRYASLLEKGQGVKKDLGQARRLYLAAAGKGNGKAMHNLAVLYAEGVDGKPDYSTAAQWFRKAAQHGIADSQYNLGVLCARGLGTAQSYDESYKWFALAAAQGDKRIRQEARRNRRPLDAAGWPRPNRRSRVSWPSGSRTRPSRCPSRPAAGIRHQCPGRASEAAAGRADVARCPRRRQPLNTAHPPLQ